MEKIFYVPTNGINDWKKLLASPDKQWKAGHSAKELAELWEMSKGFPDEFEQALPEITPLLAIPEHKVYLDTKIAPSQNDLFVLAKQNSTSKKTLLYLKSVQLLTYSGCNKYGNSNIWASSRK
jgi:hypothetical protein